MPSRGPAPRTPGGGRPSLDLHPRTAFGSKRTKQQLQVINTGNAPVTVQLRATDPDGRAEMTVEPEVLSVAPGTVGLADDPGRRTQPPARPPVG